MFRLLWMFDRILNAILPNNSSSFTPNLDDIPWNVWRYSPECLRTFPGMFGGIPRNITFPHSSRSPHSVRRSCIPDFIRSPNRSLPLILLMLLSVYLYLLIYCYILICRYVLIYCYIYIRLLKTCVIYTIVGKCYSSIVNFER